MSALTTHAPAVSEIRRRSGSQLTFAVTDGVAMTGRNVRRIMRAPDQVMFTFVSPIMFTLLFRYVFGGAIGGLGSISYVDYLIPGIAVQTAIFTAGGSGFGMAEDRGKGFLDRLRSLPMSRSAVITGRVAADTVTNIVGLVVLVLVGYAVGYRPQHFFGMLLGLLLLVLFTLSLCFVFALVGLFASNTQTVNAATFPVIFPLTFASSAFVPTASMPTWLQGFANHQPVSVLINAFRSMTIGDVPPQVRDQLFAGQSTTSLVVQSLIWTAVIGVVFSWLAVRRFNSTAS